MLTVHWLRSSAAREQRRYLDLERRALPTFLSDRGSRGRACMGGGGGRARG
eukprot:SAG31_NODE_45253_length_259_cov_1.018750_1_plen_50_part_10